MSGRSMRALQVFVAVPSPRVARRISEALLDARLCACAQTLGPMTSRYRWKGKIESAREWLLVAKTRAALFPAVERAVQALHPYDVPEIVGIEMASGHAPYLQWLCDETSAIAPASRMRSKLNPRSPAPRRRAR